MKKFHKMPQKAVCLITGLAIFLAACQKDQSLTVNEPATTAGVTTTSVGTTVVLCHGNAQSFVTKDASGNPQSVGFTFSEAALSNLPATATMTAIPLPTDNGTLVDHISVDFEPHGHPPLAIYGVPHFDIHFYMISKADQMLIDTGAKMEVLPAAAFIPPNYQPIPGGVPMMGKHWADVTSKEFNGQPFDRTFIYGSYNGKFIFHEAMVTVAYFQSKKNFTDPVKMQPDVQRAGYYPQAYSVSYDAAKKTYTVSLDQLTYKAPKS